MKYLIFFLLVACCPLAFSAEAATPQNSSWWQIMSGIIAIPTALLGFYYTFHLTKKVKMETRKLELELLSQDEINVEKRQYLPVPYKIYDYIIRFIILELAVRGWSLIAGIFSPLISTVSRELRHLEIFQSSQMLGTLAQSALVTYTTSIGYWILFIIIGLPLLKDISKDLGSSVSGLIRSKHD